MRTGIEKLNVEEIKKTMEVMEGESKDALTRAFSYLTSTEVGNFYARVLATLDRYIVYGMGTMGVSIQNGRYVLLYDPAFVSRVSYRELCATCEHEVLHIVLEHIPRYMRLRAIYENADDLKLMDTVQNLAVDLADNELLARNYPDIRKEARPLGYWVLPEGFQPALPHDMSMEIYQELLVELLKQRVTVPLNDLYRLAKSILQESGNAISDALKPKAKQGQQGKSKEEKEDASGSGGSPSEQAPPNAPDTGSGGGGGGDAGPQNETLQDQVDALDPVDQEVLKMLLSAMASHQAWQSQSAKEDVEGQAHQALTHGREVMKNALINHKKTRGTIPGYMEELIKKMLAPPVVPWTQFLHNVIQQTKQTKKVRGMARPSKILSALRKYVELNEDAEDPRFAMLRRMPVFPGVKQTNKFVIYVAVDTSGSMSTADLERAMQEIQHIQKSDSDVRVCIIYIDTAVCKEYWVGPNDGLDYSMTGRGGTDFEPAFEFVADRQRHSENAPDIFIYITDGYAPPPKTKLNILTAWVITPRGRPCCSDIGHITIPMQDFVVNALEDV